MTGELPSVLNRLALRKQIERSPAAHPLTHKLTPKAPMTLEFKTLTKSKLSSVNVRSEKHGAELVPAVDLKLTVDAANDILDKFDINLKPMLYFKAEQAADDQETLDGIDPVTNLPNLRFPKLEGPLKWDTMGAGYTLAIDYGLGGDSNLVMYGCEVNNFAFSPKEGGTVELGFRVQISNIDEHIIGKLAMLVQHDVNIFLTAPEVAMTLPEDDFPKNVTELFPNSAKTPEQAFSEAVG